MENDGAKYQVSETEYLAVICSIYSAFWSGHQSLTNFNWLDLRNNLISTQADVACPLTSQGNRNSIIKKYPIIGSNSSVVSRVAQYLT